MPLASLMNPSADSRDDRSGNLDVLAKGTRFTQVLHAVMGCESLHDLVHVIVQNDHAVQGVAVKRVLQYGSLGRIRLRTDCCRFPVQTRLYLPPRGRSPISGHLTLHRATG